MSKSVVKVTYFGEMLKACAYNSIEFVQEDDGLQRCAEATQDYTQVNYKSEKSIEAVKRFERHTGIPVGSHMGLVGFWDKNDGMLAVHHEIREKIKRLLKNKNTQGIVFSFLLGVKEEFKEKLELAYLDKD
jgi:sugar phosphate isomerase/epimerase